MTWLMMKLVGIIRISVTIMPMIPASAPMINVSALKTCPTLRFDAPMARRMPISLRRSSTLIYVMTPIMMEDTTSEMETKAIRI